MSEAQNNEGQYTFGKPQTLTFPNLDKPRAVEKNGKPTGDPKYSANFEMGVTAEDLAAMKSKAASVARARWPGRDLKELAFPFTNGDKLADKAAAKGKNREFSRGKVVLTARSKFQPKLSIVQGGKVVDLEPGPQTDALIRKAFYNGTQALAQVSFSAYEGVGNNPDGVNAYLNMVLSLQKGEKLSGGASAAEVFKGYIGSESDFDPTGDLDDEIPF